MFRREFSAGGVVLKRTGGCISILVIKDSYGRWTWPKGKIEKSEKRQDAAVREVREETGINAKVIKEIDQVKYFFKLHGDSIFKKVYIFLMESTDGAEINIDATEIQDAKWVGLGEALKILAYKGSDVILNKALKVFNNTRKEITDVD